MGYGPAGPAGPGGTVDPAPAIGTPLKYGEYLAVNIPGAVLKIIHGAGHLAMLEKPTEVNAVITTFVHSLEG
ncbi:MAG: alpha/beta hydrolase [Deltaproteobacteria bacterium]|nr:alpha/beta hydrolase [Deltaproteobacteria bacterium]